MTLDITCNVGPPSDVCWFRFAPVTSSLFAHHVYHSEIGVINAPTERYRGRGPHLAGGLIKLGWEIRVA